MTNQGSEWIITCFALKRNKDSIVFGIHSVQYVLESLSPCRKIYPRLRWEGDGSWTSGSAET